MKRFILWGVGSIFAFIFVLSIIGLLSFHYEEGSGDFVTYNCDVKNVRVTTDIEVYKDDEYIGKVKGKLTVITDPLALYDASNKKLGYAGDDYAFINQDSHLIRIDKNFYTMVGGFELVGESYRLFDEDDNYIGLAEFNEFNTKGYITDADGNVIANYRSNFLFNDYDVMIYENCELDDEVILLMCASYYSDQKFDARSDN